MNMLSKEICPILVSQFNNIQNYFYIAPEQLLNCSEETSNLLFSDIEENKIKQSFYRISIFKRQVLVLSYISLGIKENESEREGLYLVYGLAINKDFYHKNFNYIKYFILNFYIYMHRTFLLHYSQENNDAFFIELQKNKEQIITSINHYVYHLRQSLIPIQNKRHFHFKKQKYEHIIVLDKYNVFIEFAVFLEEALIDSIFFNRYDISTHKNIAKKTLLIEFYDVKKTYFSNRNRTVRMKSVIYGHTINYFMF